MSIRAQRAAAPGAARAGRRAGRAQRPTARSVIRSPQPLGAYPDKLTRAAGALGQGRARSRVPRPARRRTALAQAELRAGADAGAAHRRRRCCGASFRPSGRSRSSPATTSSMRCSALAAMIVGIPYAPISPAYSLMSSDFGKLRAIVDLLTPGLVFAGDGRPFARAIEATGAERCRDRRHAQSAGGPARRRCSPTSSAPKLTPAVDCRAGQGRARHDREIPVHLRLDRQSRRASSTPTACCARTRR